MENEQTSFRIYDEQISGDSPGSESSYGRNVLRKTGLVAAMGAALAFTIIIALIAANPSVPLVDLLRELVTFDTRSTVGWRVWRIYMPIIVAAIITGAGLALSGTVMQCILRNPLASPYTLGLSSASAFGAAFAILFLDSGSATSAYISISSPYVTTACAFGFAMLATGMILLLTRFTRVSAETMVLAGIAISAMFSAGLTLMQYMADSVQLSAIVSWSFGSLTQANWRWDVLVLLVFLPITLYFILARWDLNAIDAGDEVAKGLGVNTERFRIVGLVLSALLSAVLVSGFGVIAFVGLMAPHLARMVTGSDHRFLIPMSAATGALVLLTANTVAMNVLRPMVLPVGLLTSLLGGPMFIYLLVRRYRR
ncbi:MAG TPA: iron ABC transporter permease [Methanomassiliicoccales archaeon]|nr:iron ABC transporter permease [Methanomassiliicoccales archaeon]